ncbi:shikimate kinase [Nocardioides luteus]|uniref:Shikimate kinase n=1 Tax=Nocardioides luteus TaxID=1844 RepID=A0ABQ5T0L2_9ACTN|nr:shikimate kinase [Nocardioides luteus]MDR7310867.1 shikimate kinase [Nocardioides luteus]GGR40108.1 shikimate kinase [Nocardioides luteus]GLJ69353.1 shikimate kinase [Nocardioides luteus]
MPAVVLVGPMGAGKSTVGALLASRLGLALRDTDDDIAAAAGKSVQDIFVDEGEEHFRAVEAEAVAAALAEHDGVVSLGGGAVLADQTRILLKEHTVVYLRVGVADAVKRVGLGSGRPLLLGNVRGRIKALLEERAPIYESVATLTVDTDSRSADDVAAEIATALTTTEQK